MSVTTGLQLGAPIEFVERRDGETLTRAGVIWSEGPAPSSVWVQPDDDPASPVAVKLPAKRAAEQGQRPEVMAQWSAGWQRDAIRRCDNVNRFGHVFGVVDQETKYAKTISWHADPECPGVAGKPRHTFDGMPRTEPAIAVIDLLLGKQNRASSFLRLCLRCVYLDETAEIGATA